MRKDREEGSGSSTDRAFEDLTLAASVHKKLYMGWVIYEEVGMCIINPGIESLIKSKPEENSNALFSRAQLDSLTVPIDVNIPKLSLITVNGEEWCTSNTKVNLKTIASMAYPKAENPESFSCVYAKGPKEKPQGILFGDQEVEVVSGMRFTCIGTGNA